MLLTSHKAKQWIIVARAVSEMGTCPRRKVGALILSSRGHILATGYNGMPSGMGACQDSPCDGLGRPSGEGLDKCLAVHAEQNALLQCLDIQDARVLVTTTSPCMHCIKMLLNTPITDIIYNKMYQQEPLLLWYDLKRKLEKVT